MNDNKTPLPFFVTDKITYDIDEQNIDRAYFQQNYTIEMKKYLRIIIEILDKLDRPQNFWYDEYPDKVSLERLLDFILRNLPLEKQQTREAQRNVVRVLLWEEIMKRRKKNYGKVDFLNL